MKHRAALVERPVACAGRGQYMALVYYGSKGGQLFHTVFKYSHRDPRQKSEAEVLRGITQVIAQRYRAHIVAISVVKRCLHPKSPDVAKADRKPHYERVFSWVVQHDNSIKQTTEQAVEQRIHSMLQGHTVQSVMLPYTQHELRELPVRHVVTTNYTSDAHASVSVRGVERIVGLQDLVAT